LSIISFLPSNPTKTWARTRALPGLCLQLVTYLHTQQAPPLRSVLQTHINRLAAQSEQFLLILDNYHLLTDELRCTPEKAMTFLKQTVSIQLSHDQVERVASRTEGWLAGLQLVALSLQGRGSAGALLEEVIGSIVGFTQQLEPGVEGGRLLFCRIHPIWK
jgi:ATP/maltotriose-dependent transcriptional regulator MalT